MAIEDDDIRDREAWTSASRHWFQHSSDEAPTMERLYHYLALLGRLDSLQQSFYYNNSLRVQAPFISARDSIMSLFSPIFDVEEPRRLSGLEAEFLRAPMGDREERILWLARRLAQPQAPVAYEAEMQSFYCATEEFPPVGSPSQGLIGVGSWVRPDEVQLGAPSQMPSHSLCNKDTDASSNSSSLGSLVVGDDKQATRNIAYVCPRILQKPSEITDSVPAEVTSPSTTHSAEKLATLPFPLKTTALRDVVYQEPVPVTTLTDSVGAAGICINSASPSSAHEQGGLPSPRTLT